MLLISKTMKISIILLWSFACTSLAYSSWEPNAQNYLGGGTDDSSGNATSENRRRTRVFSVNGVCGGKPKRLKILPNQTRESCSLVVYNSSNDIELERAIHFGKSSPILVLKHSTPWKNRLFDYERRNGKTLIKFVLIPHSQEAGVWTLQCVPEIDLNAVPNYRKMRAIFPGRWIRVIKRDAARGESSFLSEVGLSSDVLGAEVSFGNKKFKALHVNDLGVAFYIANFALDCSH